MFETAKEITMKTQEYLAEVRRKTGYTNYKIGKDFGIPQPVISRYNTGKETLSETNAFQFSEVLQMPVGKIIADTKLENAINKKNVKKISFWKHQAERFKNNTTGMMTALPLGTWETVTDLSSYFILC